MNQHVAREVEQIKSSLRYGGARVLYALNADAILLNIRLHRSFVSVLKEEPDIINFPSLL